MYAEVLIDQPHEAVDRLFTYKIPCAMRGVERGSRVQVPFGLGNRLVQGYVFSIRETIDEARKIKDIARIMDGAPLLRESDFTLIEWVRERYDCLTIEAVRCIVPPPLRHAVSHLDRMWAHWAMGDDWEQAAGADRYASDAMKKALAWLYAHRSAPVREWMREAGIGQSTVASLKKRDWVTFESRVVFRDPWDDADAPEPVPGALTGEQDIALNAIIKGMAEGGGVFCLKGVTGSGKTEVYIRAIEHAVNMGKRALMLVPELSLTPQIIRRFRQRFPENVAILHSRLSEGERYDEWQRVRTGRAGIVIGARSAVFAPLQGIGVIVLDESHEDTYRADVRPRYDAREVAVRRGKMEGAAVVLGSATPRVADWYRAENGEYVSLVLSKRIGDTPLPDVALVDMRRELTLGNRTMFSQSLHDSLLSALERQKQAILLYNRRGYARFVSCRNCGQPVRCEHCDISMVYHRDGDTLKCHYCGAQRPMVRECPHCGSDAIKAFGVGVQKVEKALVKLLPQARVLRMDSDTTAGKHAYRDMLRAFGAGRYDILLGTQMVAKGLDFPGVEVVGVLAADTTLHLPDYPSAERTFRMITQAAGRAGRKGTGKVVVQTYQPGHYAVRYGMAQDYDGFYRHESDMRRLFRYPPWAGLMKIMVSGDDEDRVRTACTDIASRMKAGIAAAPALDAAYVECGAYAAPLTKIRDKYRYQVLCKYDAERDMEDTYHRLARTCIRDVDDSLYVYIEMDPVSLM
jgi:primosomal protein N' (replication factor Y)